MPGYSSYFSSNDGIPDEAWDGAAQGWRDDQGRYDSVAPASLGDVALGGDLDPGSPQASQHLGQAQMSHDQWQALRAQQLAARAASDGGEDETLSGAEGTDALAGGDGSDQLQAFRNMMASPDEEGYRNKVYLDSEGIPTVGIGHRVLPGDNLKVGQSISEARVEALFRADAAWALQNAHDQAGQAGINDPDFIRRLAAVNFQLGPQKWPRTFPKTWNLIRSGNYAEAAKELYNSKWATQTPNRVAAFRDALLRLPAKPAP